MEPGGGLVEHVDRATGRALLQLAGELDALRLAAGERGGGLSQTDVAEPDLAERGHVACDRRDGREELGGLLDRHVQDLGDGLALVVDLERLPVVAGAVADLARDVDVGQEVHLDLDRAVTRARLAASALDVEGEPALEVAAHLGLGGRGEELADVVEDAGVGRRVGPRRPADRRLVDVDHLVDVLGAGDLGVATGDGAGVVDLLGQRGVEDVVDQRRLAGAGDTGHRAEDAQREADVDVVEVVLVRPVDGQLATDRARTTYGGDRDLATTAQVEPRQGVVVVEEALDAAGVDDLAAVLAGAGTDVDDPVGGADGVLVVLDDDEGVAEVLEADQGLDQALVVALVQADRGLVEDVEDTDETGADLGGQPDPLGLATRQRAAGTVEGEVVEAHVEQELQPLVDLLEHALADLALALRQVHAAEVVGRLVDGQRTDLGDVLAAGVTGAEGDRHRDRLEPGAAAGGTRHLAHEALEAVPAGVGLGLLVAALDVGADALERGVVGALAAVAVLGDDVDLGPVALEHRRLGLGRELVPRGVEVEAELFAERVHQAQEVVGDVRAAPRCDGSLTEGGARVGDDQLRVDLHPGAEAVAGGAGAERRVEGERSGLEVVGVDGVVVGARHLLRELHLAPGVLGVEVDEVEDHEPPGQAERGLDGVGQPSLGRLLHREAVDDDLDRVLELLVERRRLVERVRLAVHPRPAEALLLELAEQLDVLALATPDDGREHLEPAALLQREDPVDDLLRRLPLDRRSARGAVRPTGAGVEQAEVVVDLGDGADGRARVLRGGLLVDADRGAQPLDEVDVWLVHLAQELAGVGAQRLDVASLALGEDRVEGQARLARAREPGEDDQGIAREIERDVLEIVLPGAPDDELVGHCGPRIDCLCVRTSVRHRRSVAQPATPPRIRLSRTANARENVHPRGRSQAAGGC